MTALNVNQLKALHRFSMHDGSVVYAPDEQCVIAFDGAGHVCAVHFADDHKPISVEAFKPLRSDALAVLLYDCDPECGVATLAPHEKLDLEDFQHLERAKPLSESEIKALTDALSITMLSSQAVNPVNLTGNLTTVLLCPMTSRLAPEDMLDAIFAHRDFGGSDIMPLSYSSRLAAPTMVMRSLIKEGNEFKGRLTTSIPLKPLRVKEFEEATHQYLGLAV